jgi:hypothetical protein
MYIASKKLDNILLEKPRGGEIPPTDVRSTIKIKLVLAKHDANM